MEHLDNAFNQLAGKEIGNYNGLNYGFGNFVDVNDNKVCFTIQNQPIKEVGVNGIQVTDMLEYCLEVYKSLNKAFPCRENSLTITHIEEALHWQEARTKDRLKRQVEGLNKA